MRCHTRHACLTSSTATNSKQSFQALAEPRQRTRHLTRLRALESVPLLSNSVLLDRVNGSQDPEKEREHQDAECRYPSRRCRRPLTGGFLTCTAAYTKFSGGLSNSLCSCSRRARQYANSSVDCGRGPGPVRPDGVHADAFFLSQCFGRLACKWEEELQRPDGLVENLRADDVWFAVRGADERGFVLVYGQRSLPRWAFQLQVFDEVSGPADAVDFCACASASLRRRAGGSERLRLLASAGCQSASTSCSGVSRLSSTRSACSRHQTCRKKWLSARSARAIFGPRGRLIEVSPRPETYRLLASVRGERLPGYRCGRYGDDQG
ncbi:hypothetical protein B0J12DRAFT_164839 [Macrophomina phaseolina]|uniref:Uncharacterized protein n=1 Tax=Macrophomina phaseolina TaxID=35725 RepID=A0ABQ8GUR6_9PEZI|nr:hypothetical protein B0J12DRAFT_164839 [Macrophomina phaseolina]